MPTACNCEKQEKLNRLRGFMKLQRNRKGALMPVMQKAQELFGYLDLEIQQAISEGLKVPLSEVYGVSTFYAQFSLEPKGEHIISVCMGTACYVKNSQKVLDKLAETLAVPVGKTTGDGSFTLEATRCLGCCGLAPVVTVGKDVHGRLSAGDVPQLIRKYQSHE